jgi:hypothetical protein
MQNRTCQASDWGVHKTGCSALPSGELVPAKVKWSKARADEVQRLEGVFRSYGRKLEVSVMSLARAYVGWLTGSVIR